MRIHVVVLLDFYPDERLCHESRFCTVNPWTPNGSTYMCGGLRIVVRVFWSTVTGLYGTSSDP